MLIDPPLFEAPLSPDGDLLPLDEGMPAEGDPEGIDEPAPPEGMLDELPPLRLELDPDEEDDPPEDDDDDEDELGIPPLDEEDC